MNYETTITADAADGVATDFAGARTVPSFALPRWLLVGGAGLFVLLLLALRLGAVLVLVLAAVPEHSLSNWQTKNVCGTWTAS